MAYTLEKVTGGSKLTVGERKWGDSVEINFGAMTSCIGIIGRRNGENQIRAIHLSVVDKDGTPVYDQASGVKGQVENIMSQAESMRACIGQTAVWNNDDNRQLAGFFINLMQTLEIDTWVPLNDGNIKVRWNKNGKISYNYNNNDDWQEIEF
ncbi:hypothetical protein [Moorena sp. SIO4G3]|uniref:hypothetical protein n=1 Tax=Moorena sp. SIO4G3 TaxID=2607821 RepID=UPI00142BD231|nr:hypothetical protein [Moorena sp. SIO4G3]NEO76301.1 hypothetical protein [Moorena sp. SIO4G3]